MNEVKVVDSSFDRNNNFTLLKLLSAFAVLFAHVSQLGAAEIDCVLFRLSALGVDTFFVVSGFLTTWSLARSPHLREYALKRFVRIYPLYIVVVVLQAIMGALIGAFHGIQPQISLLKYIACNGLLLNYLQPTIQGVFESNSHHAINGPLWTIKVFVLFYISLPLMLYMYRKIGPAILALLYIFSTLFFILTLGVPHMAIWHFDLSVYGNLFHSLNHQFPAELRFFIVGIALYYYGRILSRRKTRFVVFAVSSAALCYFINNEMFSAACYPVVLGSLVYIVAFFVKPIRLTDISYSMYLLHFPIIQVYVSLHIDTNPELLIVAVATTVLMSILATKYIERPAIRLGRRFMPAVDGSRSDKVMSRFAPSGVMLHECRGDS